MSADSPSVTELSIPTRILCYDSHERAADIYRRYRELYIGEKVVRAMLELKNDPSSATRFADRRRVWEDSGGYIESIAQSDISAWLSSGSFVVAEAARPDTESGRFVPVAQCVYRLPEGNWVIPVLAEPVDEIYDPILYESILADGPGATALIDYLGVLPAWSASRLAGAARYAGMQQIMRMNLLRAPGHRIKYAIGLSFAIRGLKRSPSHGDRAGSTSLTLEDDLGQGMILNSASRRAISTSARCPATLIGKWNSAPPVPVHVDGATYFLDVDWYCYVRRVPGAASR